MSTRGIQYIIDNASAIEFNRRKTIGQSVVRSGRIRTAERASTNPWQLTITPAPIARYELVRDVIEGITIIDRNTFVWIDFTSNLNYITAYKGELNTTQLDNLRVATGTNWTSSQSFNIDSITGNTNDNAGYSSTATFDYMVLTDLPSLGSTTTNTSTFVSSTTVILSAGDWIQFKTDVIDNVESSQRGLPRTVPLDVLRGTGNSVIVPVSRPFIWDTPNSNSSNDKAGAQVSIGSSVRMGMVITMMPSWKLKPGKLVEWTGDFELYEYLPGTGIVQG